MDPRLSLLVALVVSLLLGNSDSETTNPDYYCLEDYKQIGDVLRDAKLSAADKQGTSGHIARQCSAACSADPACSAFKAAGNYPPSGARCRLLSNTSAALPAALQLPAGADWPPVLVNVTAGESINLRSVGWLCFRGAELWDTFGEATHALIHTGTADLTPPDFGRDYHCTFGSDVAGTNLQQYTTNINSPLDCDALCANSSGCTVWTFAAAQNGSGQAPYNCFVKADPFRGENGWTGKPKPDIWIPDSQVDCFVNLADWRQLGLTLSPAIKTINHNNTYYTLFPERVTFSEANRSCSNIPGGQLAVLDSRMEVDMVYRDLLSTLSPETGVTSAWVGVRGNNTHYNPAAQNQTGLAQGSISLGQIGQLQPQPIRNRTVSGPETTLSWLNGEAVDPNQLRRLTQHDVWTVHDVIWNQQYVPDSSRYVCGRVLVQAPPTAPVGPVDASAVLPGIWYFDCDKLAAFVCQSPDPPLEPMVGRSIVTNQAVAAAAAGSSPPNWRLAVAVVVPILAVLLAVWQLTRVYSRQVSRLPELIRQQRKRALGRPSWGRMSIVVTDIQGFTNLMRDAPDHMAQALLLHNQVMKHACYDNIGYVLEQEGDSFTVAFHEPQDAVAFTLQVQQALMDQPWPTEISYQDAWDSATSLVAATPAEDQQQQQQQRMFGKQQSEGRRGRYSTDRLSVTAAAAGGTDSPKGRRTSLEYILGWIPGLGLARSDEAAAAAGGGGGVGDRRSSEANWLSDPNLAFAVPSTTGTDYTSWSPAAAAAAAGGGSMISPSAGGYSRRRAAWLQQLVSPAAGAGQRGSSSSQCGGLFKGVRVRMGVASGYVVRGQEVKSSAVYKTAQDVSNAANGGQVLMDETTFTAVKEELWRLGLVTAAGLNYDLLYTGSSSRSSTGGSGTSSRGEGGSFGSRSRLLECLTGRRSFTGSSNNSRVEQALALDMGCYDISGSSTSSSSQCLLWTKDLGSRFVQQYHQYLQQQLQSDQQSDDDLTTDGTTHVIMGGSDQADVEQGYFTPADSATSQHCGALSGPAPSPVVPQQPGAMLLQSHRQQHWDFGQQQQQLDLGLDHPGHEKLGGVWGAVLGGVFGFRQADRGAGDRSRRGATDASGRSAGVNMFSGPSVGSFPSSWNNSGVMGSSGASTIRLYQIIAPSLIGRAALFGSDLAIPKHWKQLDAPYFAAPGLSTSSSSSSKPGAGAVSTCDSGVDGGAGDHQHVSDTAGQNMTSQRSGQVVVDQFLVNQGSVKRLLDETTGSSHDEGMMSPGATPTRTPEGIRAGSRSRPSPLVVVDPDASPFAAAAAAASAAAANVADREAAAAEAPGGSSSSTPTRRQMQQQNKPLVAAAAANSVVSNSALLRGMSLRADFTMPSMARLGSGMGAAATVGGGFGSSADGFKVSVLRPQYPAVTIVFAMVEGAQQLLRCPTLVRSSHVLIHRLLLSTMTSFPGSYLVRAQEGDLKYMAAFPTATAAAEWCMTVQEASLYVPYPPEVLGLSSCGVQLDAEGRLVFRGVRFKMGLSEGTPKCILPDHLGRADYHGPFVNQAARFADAAAHGGQIVTDTQLADNIMAAWHSYANNRGIKHSAVPGQQRQQPQQSQQQLNQHQHQQLPCNPGILVKSMSADTGLVRGPSAATTAAADMHLQRRAAVSQPPTTPSQAGLGLVSVECSWLGSFLYKGNPKPLEMVCFAPKALSGRSYPASSPGGKGVRVVQRVGVMDQVSVLLPAAVEGWGL